MSQKTPKISGIYLYIKLHIIPIYNRPKPKGLKLNKDAQEFKINEEGVINSNYLEDEEESTHVFIGFQQPLDLMTHNPPQVVPIQPNNNYYLPNQNIYNQQIPMNFQGFYPNNNYNYYG